jgi:lipoyl(octanoyl) transferase
VKIMSADSEPLDPCLPPGESHFSIQFHLLGRVSLDDCHALQSRLVYELGGVDDDRMVVLLCEHPWSISIGRRGSRGHIRLTNEQLRRRQWDVRWVSRGGGCVLHAPGQIALYPLVPLSRRGWTLGEYLHRLRGAVLDTLGELGVRGAGQTADGGVWGRTGQLAACGVAVRQGITSHGMFLNVCPSMRHYPFVDVIDPRRAMAGEKTTMGSLLAERRRAVSVPQVRAALIAHLAARLGTHRYHLMTGHPWLVRNRERQRELRSHAS